MVRHAAGKFASTLAVSVAVMLVVTTPAAAETLPSAAGNQLAVSKVPVMTGSGGAVASVDADATQVGIDILKAGGNAADAAIATAAALGVTEPFSAGIGGGGFLVYYDAQRRKVLTIDGRETAPASFTETTYTDGAGKALTSPTCRTPGCPWVSREPRRCGRRLPGSSAPCP